MSEVVPLYCLIPTELNRKLLAWCEKHDKTKTAALTEFIEEGIKK